MRLAQLVLLAAVPTATAVFGRAVETEQADLVLRGGTIVTMDERQPQVEALAARDERIVALGSNADIKRFIGPQTRLIELHGQFVMPGFIEGHGHFLALGRSLMHLDLSGAKSWDEVVSLVAAEVQRRPEGEWIVGRGWHQEKWKQTPVPNVEGYPTHHGLSRVAPDNPLLLVHGSGHMSLANRAAMDLADIDRNTPDPPGGTLLRDARGDPTGVFRETAQAAVRRAFAQAQRDRSPEQLQAETLRAVGLAADDCLSKGVTSFQDAGSSFETVELFKNLADQRKLPLRLWVMLREDNSRLRERLAECRMIDYGGHRLTVRAIKQMVDGALGAHGAWLLEPYNDLPESRGLNVTPIDVIQETALLAVKHDYQLCVHAIGDRANRAILDIFQTTFRSFPHRRDLRWRIEHAQHLHPADIPRFAELGVIASMQANHCTSDAPFVVARLGVERARPGAYAWRSLLDAGATLINGTDAPVEDVDPIKSLYAAVTRRTDDGTPFFPEQCMTRREALRGYTRDAAFAAFEDNQKGTLSVGKLADVVVLSKNVLTCPAADILDARVLYTIVGGRIAYRAGE